VNSDIKSTIIKIITDKPVRKTPYQVKGVFIRHFKEESIVPMLNGSNRDKFLYPRVQVKILDEQIYLIGIKEGSEPVLSISEKIKELNFGNITFKVENIDIEDKTQEFISLNQLIKYKFITPWVALNHMTGAKYKKLKSDDKISYLNKLLGQNIVFLANEFNLSLEKNIYTKLELSDLKPKKVDEKNWGSFEGEFKTNCILPNYIGLGNGITRGFGTFFGNTSNLNYKDSIDKKNNIDSFKKEDGLDVVIVSDVPKPKRRKKRNKKINNKYSKKHKSGVNKKLKYNYKNKKHKKNSNLYNNKKTKNIFNEDFNIEHDKNNYNRLEPDDNIEEKNFNTEKHHKKQHKF